jgi:hypothetical protein
MEAVTAKQIHDEFDAASETLYLDAVRNRATRFDRIKKSDRLKKLGFIRSSEIIESEPAKEHELPIYYRETYPFLKFITSGQLENICEKYGLIYAEAKYYTGDIPEKNLREIENSKPLHKKDVEGIAKITEIELLATRAIERHERGYERPSRPFEEKKRKDYDDLLNSASSRLAELISKDPRLGALLSIMTRERPQSFTRALKTVYGEDVFDVGINRSGLYITANKELFDLTKLRIIPDTHEYQVKDPIVFRWCRGGLLIITKWGEEANDPALVIPELN